MAASTPLGFTDWLSFAASFVLVLLLIGFLFFLLKRLGGGRLRPGNDKQISVLESQAIGNRQRIVLVRAKDREILLGMTMHQISTLATWSPEEVARGIVAAKSRENAAPHAGGQSGIGQLLGYLDARRKS